MSKQIVFRPEAVRDAGKDISRLNAKGSYGTCPSYPSSSHGLVAGGIIEIIEELENVEKHIENILKIFPEKLDKVATVMEEKDNAAAGQFK